MTDTSTVARRGRRRRVSTRRAATPTDPPGWRTLELHGRGVTFAYHRPGPPGAPTVVLLHGWIATGASNWRGTLAALAESYHVVALDHRGHGRGIRADRAFTLEDCADDVVALLDALGVGRAMLVGYSMGGPIAQLTWRRWPERVDALVLCATAADFTQPAIPPPVLGVAETVVSATLAATRPVRAANPFARDPAIDDDGEVAEGLLDALGRHDAGVVHRALHQIVRYDARAWIGAVDVPAAVIVTGRDRTVSPTRQRALAAAIPGAAVIDTDGGHLLPFTDPDATADALRAACRSVLARLERDRRPRRARLRARWRRWVARATARRPGRP